MKRPLLFLNAAAFGALTLALPIASHADEPPQPPPAVPSAPAPTPTQAAAPTPPPAAETVYAVQGQTKPGDVPAAAFVAFGRAREYTPLVSFKPGGVALQAYAHLAFRGEGVSSFAVDNTGNTFQTGAVISPQVRLGAQFDTGKVLKYVNLHAEYEHDLPTGYWASDTPVEGIGLPASSPAIDHQLRKAYLRASFDRYLHIGGGFMTNQFGLGLLANDGAQGNWAPGSGRFADNRSGDRVLRGFLGTGPLSDLGFTATFAVDQVQGDDVLLPGDSAYQIIGTASVGYGKPWGAGLFVVQRHQDTEGGARIDATVVDFTARYSRVMPGYVVSMEGELAVVTGDTTLAPTPEFPVHKLRQIGAALRTTLRTHYFGGVIDLLYFSGDGNPDDQVQSAFKADPNFETGLLLFRYVMAAQTGRSAVTAANLELVGEPAQDLDRLPTRGSPSNAFVLFPRFMYRPVDGLEATAGLLLAWSQAPLFDPLNSRVSGGIITNSLGGKPGSYLGTEIDLGARHRMILGGTELTLGVEGALFLPGDAFVDVEGKTMDPVLGGRALLGFKL
ncbi:MAG: hypothetical protein IPK82_18760 [Polyangiaceae bacterium]|nr:hypothetical protein [Polyangiaceae bacterium]